MTEIMQYRGYEGSVQFSDEDQCMHVRLLCARDMVIYGGADRIELEENFKGAVDEYLAFCEAEGKTPDTPSNTTTEILASPE